MDELKRLGRPGAYRLGDLRTRGTDPVPPRPYRPSFTRPVRRGPLPVWALAFAAGTAAVAGAGLAGLFFAPFLVGVPAGLLLRSGGWRPRVMLAAAAAMAVLGWGMALAWRAWHATPPGVTTRVVTGVTGLPVHGARGIVVALLVGALQALAGVGLGRVLAARLENRRASAGEADEPGVEGEPNNIDAPLMLL